VTSGRITGDSENAVTAVPDLCTDRRPTGRRMGKQLLRMAGYAAGWIVSGLSLTPLGRRNFMKNDDGSSVFSMTCERFSTQPVIRDLTSNIAPP
jgi:hypothetical protein